MAKIQVTRKSTIFVPNLSSYKLILEVNYADGLAKEVFIKQRLRNFKTNTFEDVFAAVATPVQLEDLPAFAPNGDVSYFRDSAVELIARTVEQLDEVFNSIMYELEKLTTDVELLGNLEVEGIYDVGADITKSDIVTQYNITIRKGATYNQQLVWKQGGTPVNNIGYTAKMQIRTQLGRSLVMELSDTNGRIILGGATGSITLLISAADTATLEPGVYIYSLKLTHGNAVYDVLEGQATVINEVTV